MNDIWETRLADVERRLLLLEQARSASPAASGHGLDVTEGDIRAAYRMFLHREPDDGGFRHFMERASSGEYGFDDLISGMTDCEEYRVKHARKVVTVDVEGVRVCVDPDEPELGRAIVRDGAWEPHIMHAISNNLRPGDVFVDVGANVGIMSFQASSAVGATGHVYAFEPNQDNVQRFLQGVMVNGFENITLFPFAASDRASIFSIQGHSNTHLVPASIGGRLVQAFQADDLLDGVPKVSLIKIDIEGHELFALNGLRRTMSRHNPLVLCEFNPRCLRSNADTGAVALAENIFGMTRRVDIVEKDLSLTSRTSASELMAIWERRNGALVAAGELDDGLLHFDLLFRAFHPAK